MIRCERPTIGLLHGQIDEANHLKREEKNGYQSPISDFLYSSSFTLNLCRTKFDRPLSLKIVL